MRYVYSLVRFVPAPATGECVNIGMIVGSDESREWILKKVSRQGRATRLDENKVFPEVARTIAELESTLDEFTRAQDDLLVPPELPSVSESWIQQLAQDWQNIVQLTDPLPVVADSADDAIEKLWPHLIREPEPRPRGISRRVARARVKQEFASVQIGPDNFLEQVRLETESSHSGIDLAVHSSRVVHMTQCWSFQVDDVEAVVADIKGWAWTMRDLRRNGGQVVQNGHPLEVDCNVPLNAVYVQATDGQDQLLAEAISAFEDAEVNAQPVTLDQISVVGRNAKTALSPGAT